MTYASRIRRLEPSLAVTDILKLAERPDVISFAGGLPDPRSLPVESIRASTERVLREDGAAALNYGPNPGYSRLREWIAERMGRVEGVAAGPEEILVTSGGVDALNLVVMALLDPGAVVLAGAPTYMVALHVFRAAGARTVAVPLDEEGIDPDALEVELSALEREGSRPRFLYTIPSFQNPSGITQTAARRRRLVDLCSEHDLPIVEDHAYAELRYDGEKIPSLKALAPRNVIFLHTFSKIMGPGLRLGWACADRDIVERLGLCKLGTDQCANTLTQRIALDYARDGGIERQVASSIELYRTKRDLLLAALARHLPEGTSWTRPAGGFFVWVRLPEGTDTVRLLRQAIEHEKTAFVAGPVFFEDGRGGHHLRLSFSYVADEDIEDGVRRLARVLAS